MLKHGWLRLLLAGMVLFSLAGGGGSSARSTSTAVEPFADAAFQRVWTRTDKLVEQGQTGQPGRSWFWGPQPNTGALLEEYAEAPGGARRVQYFDKSRMEINNPNGDPNSAFYVTNGLLTVELISGQMAVGNGKTVQRASAELNMSGDADDNLAPTYARFAAVSNIPNREYRQADKTGQLISDGIDRNARVTPGGSWPAARYAMYVPETGHNVADVFWTFLNQQGPVLSGGAIRQERLIDPWFYASGYPISDPYWAREKAGGQIKNVLIQAFQRRVLTYTPTNNAPFQVEMGNIGQHYYTWRYLLPEDRTAQIVRAQGAADICPRAEGVGGGDCAPFMPTTYTRSRISATGQARTGAGGSLILQTRSTVFQLDQQSTLKFKELTNDIERALHAAGRLTVAHDPSGLYRIEIEAGRTRVDATDSRFSIVVTATTAPNQPEVFISVPQNGGQVSVTLRGVPAPVTVSPQQEVTIRTQDNTIPPPQPISPAEQQYWGTVLTGWQSIPELPPNPGFVSGPTPTPSPSGPTPTPHPLRVVQVAAPAVNYVFSRNGVITVTDSTANIALPGTSGNGFLQSRTGPPGEPGTAGAGLIPYEYRIDLTQLQGAPGLVAPCVSALSLDFGLAEPLNYDGSGVPADVYVVTQGGVGNVAPSRVEQSGTRITFRFSPGVCPGRSAGSGDTTYFMGLASRYAPRSVVAQLQDTVGAVYTLNARAPAHP